MIRLLEAPDEMPLVLRQAQAAGLQVLVRPVVAGDEAVALAAGAGLHHPDAGPPRRAGPGLASTSCHDAGRIRAAAAAGLDLCTLAPVFSPRSKPGDARGTLGLDGLRTATTAAPGIPVLALGGVTPDRVAGLLDAGAHGVAGIGCFFRGLHVDPDQAARIVRAVRACHPRTASS